MCLSSPSSSSHLKSPRSMVVVVVISGSEEFFRSPSGGFSSCRLEVQECDGELDELSRTCDKSWRRRCVRNKSREC